MAPQHRPACNARPAAHPFLVCTLDLDHEGPHTAWHNWRDDDDDETPTVQFPPIGSTTRRRPPVPAARVVELTGRVELLQALGRELQRELAELSDVDEDQADDEAPR